MVPGKPPTKPMIACFVVNAAAAPARNAPSWVGNFSDVTLGATVAAGPSMTTIRTLGCRPAMATRSMSPVHGPGTTTTSGRLSSSASSSASPSLTGVRVSTATCGSRRSIATPAFSWSPIEPSEPHTVTTAAWSWSAAGRGRPAPRRRRRPPPAPLRRAPRTAAGRVGPGWRRHAPAPTRRGRGRRGVRPRERRKLRSASSSCTLEDAAQRSYSARRPRSEELGIVTRAVPLGDRQIQAHAVGGCRRGPRRSRSAGGPIRRAGPHGPARRSVRR